MQLVGEQKRWLTRTFGDRLRLNVPMAPLTSFRIGGAAEALVRPGSQEELSMLVSGARKREIPYRVVGGGTNLLVKDEGVSGVVIVAGLEWGDITVLASDPHKVTVSIGAGVPLKRFCRTCLSKEWKGVNFAIGIPGTIGGALVMNAGTGSGSMVDVLVAMHLLTPHGDLVRLPRERLRAEHRRISWDPARDEVPDRSPSIIVAGEFQLTLADAATLRAEAARSMRDRATSQPLGVPSAGCIFKNPAKGPAAGWLIETAGLKGTCRGGARISERHANFIVNTGGATASDVLALMDHIRETVWQRFHIQLEPEVKIVGD